MSRIVSPARPAGLRSLDRALATVAVAALLLVVIVWPVTRMAVVAVIGIEGTLAGGPEIVSAARLGRLLVQTLGVAVVSTILTVAAALVLAYAVARTDIPGKRLITLTIRLPVLAPPFVAALALLLLFGRDGVGIHGIVIAQVLTFLPHAYVVLAHVFREIDPDLEEVAESLGASAVTTWRRITLALARPGLLAAALGVLVLCMADLANPLLVGGRYEVLATAMYVEVLARGDLVSAAGLGVALALPCLVASLIVARVGGVGAPAPATLPAPARLTVRAPARPASARARWSLGVACAALALGVAVAHGVVVVGSLVPRWGSDWAPSLVHYADAVTGGSARPIRDSTTLALGAGVIGTALALAVASVIARRRGPEARAIEGLSLAPAALPGTAIGLGYLLAFGTPPLLLTGTVWIVMVSVVLSALPVGVRTARDALERIDPRIEEAALGLGASRARVFARVLVPLWRRDALAIFVAFFVAGMVALSTVVFLVYPGFEPASVAALGHIPGGRLGIACALGTLVLVVTTGATVLLWMTAGREVGPREW